MPNWKITFYNHSEARLDTPPEGHSLVEIHSAVTAEQAHRDMQQLVTREFPDYADHPEWLVQRVSWSVEPYLGPERRNRTR